jgi:two-component system KDP operon response regulator KdpE
MDTLLLSDGGRSGEMVEASLRAAGMVVRVAVLTDPSEVSVAIQDVAPRLVVAGWDGWGCRGAEVVQSVRRVSSVPLMVTSGRQDDEDEVRALDLGADAYACLPIDPALLRARLRALMRRSLGQGAEGEREIRIGDLIIDTETRSVTARGSLVKVTPSEYSLLRLLARNPGRSVSRETIQSLIWPVGVPPSGGQLKVFVSRLRKKLNPEVDCVNIITDRGVGYRLEVS